MTGKLILSLAMAKKGVQVNLPERVSKKTFIAHLPSKHAEVVIGAINDMPRSAKALLRTLKFSNGKKFAYHAQRKAALGAVNYFARPYHSWEGGLNENHNGLTRQYLPRVMALDKVTAAEITLIQNDLHNRPRKLLGYKKPNEIYDAICLAV